MNWSSNMKITSFTHDWSDFYLRANPYLRWVNLRSLWCCVFHDLWGFFEGLRGLCGGEGWGCVCEIVGYGYGDSGLQPWLLSRGPDCATKIVLIAPFPNKLKFQNNCTTSVCFTFPQCAFSNVTSVHLDQVKFRNNYTASLTILVKFDQSSHPGFTPRSQSWTDITLKVKLIKMRRVINDNLSFWPQMITIVLILIFDHGVRREQLLAYNLACLLLITFNIESHLIT